MTVYIMRGVPGSGKSYNVNKLIEKHGKENVSVCSADHFFINQNGVYVFDRNKLGAAHDTCKAKFVSSLKNKQEIVIVDNTNTVWREIEFYVTQAFLHQYEVALIESSTPWAKDAKECFKKNTHGVPLEAIQAMIDRFVPNDEILKKIKSLYY